jgi:Cys-tRNA(Pro) deacylase
VNEKQNEHNSSYNSSSIAGTMDLESYLRKNSVWHKFIDKPETIHTKDAALHTGIDLERITKSLVFLADGKPVLVIVPGTSRVSTAKLRDLVKTRDVVLVPFEKAKDYSGYDPGATPPVNHKNISMTIIEKRLCDYKTIYGGGGTRNKLIEMRPEDIIRLNGATIANVVE